MNQPPIDEIIALLREFPVSEIEIARDGFRIKAASGTSTLQRAENLPVHRDQSAPPDLIPVAPPQDEKPILISAGMVGHFHHPNPPLRYGVEIAEGEVVGTIESIKVMNEVESEVVGRLAETLIDDGAAVEYGQPLYRLVP